MFKPPVDENRDLWKDAMYSPTNDVTDLVPADQVLQSAKPIFRANHCISEKTTTGTSRSSRHILRLDVQT